jgi:hypothetical protein
MCESPGNAARIAALSADQAPTAIIGCPHMTIPIELMPQYQDFGFQPPRLEVFAQHPDKKEQLQSCDDHVLIRC